MAILEAGKNYKANMLKWLNKQLYEIKTNNTNSYLSSLDADFPYTIISACTTAEHERDGIAIPPPQQVASQDRRQTHH
jgi:hypothetical protein